MTLPACLQVIADQARRAPLPPHNLDEVYARGQRFAEEVLGAIPEIYCADGGEILHLGPLSPGCQACVDGRWDCLFITARCNLACPFCCSPLDTPPEAAGSAYGETPEEVARAYAGLDLAGISFSGGEPFLELQRLLDWLAFFKPRFPRAYFWVYTNGLLALPAHLERLAALGLDEVRFNAAAAGYTHPRVLAHMRAAAALVPNLAVEIPALPEQGDQLLASLEAWCEAGVRFLNLHELMHEPGTPAEALPGERFRAVLPDGHVTLVNTASRALVLRVMQEVRRRGLPLAVNDCSLQRKIRQVRGRRRGMARLALAAHEQYVEEPFRDDSPRRHGGHGDKISGYGPQNETSLYQSCCAYRGEEIRFFHPDRLAEMRRALPGWNFARLARLAPLALREPERWVAFEILA
jgi:pyruvate formate-lyase activating enzyme-like uncharacterized protein